tara:strand:+ start:4501 stop:4659 length:159 start_codon:yes stop_codon:yes gene_type:complete
MKNYLRNLHKTDSNAVKKSQELRKKNKTDMIGLYAFIIIEILAILFFLLFAP